MTKDELLQQVREGKGEMPFLQKLRLTILLSLPAIIADFSFIAMEMIDASMLGHLSTDEAAAVGLVSTTIWLFGGLTSAFAAGFSVQVAHRVGANDFRGARDVIRQGITSGIAFSILMSVLGLLLAPHLPHWLGAAEHICDLSTEYFSIFCMGMPLIVTNSLAAGSLRCSGNIKTPSMLMAMMCFLDVCFNYIFIFIFGLGTAGAAYGTIVAYVITVMAMLYAMIVKDHILSFIHTIDGKHKMEEGHWKPSLKFLKKAGRIGAPLALERGVMCTAQVMTSSIIAPLGTVAIAANTFGINIEALCYMPAHGIAETSTTLVGQSKGAERRDLMHSFAWISIGIGVIAMMFTATLMWFFAPEMLGIITPDDNVITLGTEVLRIEAWAEPLYAASIVATHIFVGAGKTLVPSLMNLGSIWCVRVPLALLLAPEYGLKGVWIAMALELCFRGIILTAKLCTRGWSYIKPMEMREVRV